jgi:hypothetical protein
MIRGNMKQEDKTQLLDKLTAFYEESEYLTRDSRELGIKTRAYYDGWAGSKA